MSATITSSVIPIPRDTHRHEGADGARSNSDEVVRPFARANATTEAELVLARFRILASCRCAWLEHLWEGGRASEGSADATVAGILSDADSPEAEAAWLAEQPRICAWRAELKEIDALLASWPDSRLTRLAQIFQLSGEQIELMQLCAAVAFDPSLGLVCAHLHNHAARRYLTEDMAARLLGLGRAGVWNRGSNLFRWELIDLRENGVGEPLALLCDPHIKDWLLGRSVLDEVLLGAMTALPAPATVLPEWPLAGVAEWIANVGRRNQPARIRVIIVGSRGAGKSAFAAAVAQAVGLPLLGVDSNEADEGKWQKLFLRAHRQAFLDSAALAWSGEAATRRLWPSGQTYFPLQFVLCEPGAEPPAVHGIMDRKIRLPMPEAATRVELWRQSSAEAQNWAPDELRTLAMRHQVWPGDIKLAARMGVRTPQEAALAVREAARGRFGTLAEIMECPFTPEDLVVPAGVKQMLDALAFEAGERAAFWEEPEPRRLFPQGRALIALFSGPPGTGKTMAAQVLAARLGLDLCRVNVAQLVSKWVGETAKNCERVIRLAAETNVLLFLDEADALFARRATEIRDAQDKFANTDTAYLLQAIESYPGLALLATNLKSNLDSAFTRRFRYVVEFQKPDATLQKILWRRLVGGLAGGAREQVLASALEQLGAAVDVTGAQIKSAVVGAVFAAKADKATLGMRHLLQGLDIELGKEGRGVAPRERERLLKLEPAP